MGTVPAPYTPIAGDDATQARVLTWADAANYLLGNATSGGSKRPVCVMRQTVAQSIPNTTITAITLDTEDVDYDNGHSTVTNTSRYTAATAGWYDFQYAVGFALNGTGEREVVLRQNGVTTLIASGVIVAALASDFTVIGRAWKVFLNAGDYIEVLAYQSSGGALNTVAGWSVLSAEWRSN